MTKSNLYFKQLEIGPMANFVYLIGDRRTSEAAVVDPAWDVEMILSTLESDEMHLKHVLVTHGHPDHVNGVEDILNRTNARLHMHKDEVPWVGGWKETAEGTQDHSKIQIGEIEIEVMHTPGHTPGSQCFLLNDRVVSGDTLFIDACGRSDLPGGDPEVLYESLTQKLMKLDDQLTLFPGHNYAPQKSVSMGEQKKSNPFLKATTMDAFLNMVAPAGFF